MRKKFTLKIIFLTPLIALLLSSSFYFILNYPRSYTRVTTFTEDTSDSLRELLTPKEIMLPQIDEQELLSRLEKRMSHRNLRGNTDGMSQNTALEILSSTVRISAGKNKGTGVIVFNEVINSIHYSYIITNNHVVNDKTEVEVESFTYLKQQTISSTNTFEGRVIAKDPALDLALIQVLSANSVGKPSFFETADIVTNLTLYQPVYISGCGLANPPYVTSGNVAQINSIRSIITAFSIFGNSGGGVFDAHGKLVGIVRGVSVVQVPTGPRSPSIRIPEPNLTHMIPGPLVRSWLMVTGFSFLIEADSPITHHNFLKDQQKLILEKIRASHGRKLLEKGK